VSFAGALSQAGRWALPALLCVCSTSCLSHHQGTMKGEPVGATFLTVDGKRYSVPGDFATVEADGSITLLGRGSVCINTAGEKVFPEEVEETLKTHAAVRDANVVGVPDDKWGQAVVAVVSFEPGASAATADLVAHCRETLAGYKVPKRFEVVDVVRRGPNGKADYRWAASVASGA